MEPGTENTPSSRLRCLGLPVVLGLVVVVATVWVLRDDTSLVRSSLVPEFVPGPAFPPAGGRVLYDFSASNPFERGKVWIWAWDPTWKSSAAYLFDIETESVSGRLHNARPLALTPDQSECLCVRRELPRNHWLSEIKFRITRLSGGRITFQRPIEVDREEYWLVDLHGGRNRRVGGDLQIHLSGSTGRQSPDFRRWQIVTTMNERVLIDLSEGTLTRFNDASFLDFVWLDNHRLLYKTRTNFLEAFDIQTHTQSVFLTRSQIGAFLSTNHLSIQSLSNYTLFSVWNGSAYRIYLAPPSAHIGQKYGEEDPEAAWLIEVQNGTPKLRLKARHFNFHPSARLNAEGSSCVYSGETFFAANAVYLRDLKTGVVKTLVAPDKFKEYNSLPNFYGNKVIYIQDNALWIVNTDGTDRQQLFPPTKAR